MSTMSEVIRLQDENRRLREQLRGTIPADAVRAIAVEAIRDATGYPDIMGRDGEYLVDKIEKLARMMAK